MARLTSNGGLALMEVRRADPPELPTIALAQSTPRAGASNQGPYTSGTMYLSLVRLQAGELLNGVAFYSGSTAAVTPTNQFAVLVKPDGTVLVKGTDITTAPWAVNAKQTLPLAAPFSIPATADYYIGRVIVAATPPSHLGVVLVAPLSVEPPVPGMTGGAGFTDPASVGGSVVLAARATIDYGLALA